MGPGNIIEQPKAGLHNVYNPTCQATLYTAVFNANNPLTYNVRWNDAQSFTQPSPQLAYGLPQFGNFTNEATYVANPQLRFPSIAPTGQWVYNPTCLSTCNITLPANLAAASAASTSG